MREYSVVMALVDYIPVIFFAIAGVLFVLAFLFSMGMGYAGRLDPTLAWVNWLEQGINIGSQACLLGGMLILHRAIGEERKEA